MIKKIAIGFVIVLVGLLIWQHELVGYGLMQARGQLIVIMGAQPIDSFLESPDFPDSLKNKLQLIKEIRQFSIDSLGINGGDSYKSLFDQKGKTTLWNLSACEPFQLEAKKWNFPFLGSFSYKGFFDLEMAKVEQKQLKAEGFDTRIRSVSGWSTLGWFDDPILSNMLKRSEGQLAEVIIHELTHGTLYIKDSVDYNENLATFIGEKGAERFLIRRYGQESNQYLEYIQSESDYKKYISHFIRGAKLLDSLYNSDSMEAELKKKNQLKEQLIRAIVINVDTIDFYQPNKYKNRFDRQLPNNTYFMSFLRYHSKQDVFENEFKMTFDQDIKSYLTFLKEKYPSL